MKGVVYRIVNTKTSDTYIGSTTQTVKNRFKAHRSNARIGKKCKLYHHMRTHGIEHFSVEVIEEIDVENVHQLRERELAHFEKSLYTLNEIAPKSNFEKKDRGRVYRVNYVQDLEQFYVGSTVNDIAFRLTQHRTAALDGTTPFYTFMREHGRDEFTIECIEDNVPTDQLIEQENHWIQELRPPLNTNTNLCMTDKERDRLKYLKNREKRLQQVNARLQIKRAEVNVQKKMHYHANKDRIQAKAKATRDALEQLPPYVAHPGWTHEFLISQTMIHLHSMAKRLGWKDHVPIHKLKLIDALLERQDTQFRTQLVD